MILMLELDKSYGTQNEDIAKKNKLNKITLTLNSVKESDDYDNAIQETITVTSDSNTQTKIIATNFSENDNEKFSSYIGAVEYKTYTISLDLNQTEYEKLKTAKNPVPHTETYNGNRSVRNMSGYAGNSIYSLSDYNSFKAKLEENDIVTSMAGFKYTAVAGNEVNLWSSEVDFIANKYTSEDVENNVVSEWSEIIQTANDTIKEPNEFSTLSQLAKTEITYWNNDGQTLTFSIRIPYGIYFWVCNDVYDTGRSSYLETIYSAEPIIWTRYLISSTTISLTTSLDVSTENVTYFNGNREYSANSSFMFTKGNTFNDGTSEKVDYSEYFSTQIYEAYKNGKLEVKIKYPVGEVFDKFGNSVLYSANFGLVRKMGDDYFDEDGKKIEIAQSENLSPIVPLTEGAICELLKGGQPIYKKTDGSEQYFLIQSSNMVYTGILVNELNLVESTEELPEYTLTTNQSDVVTRVSSPIAGATTGSLSNGAIIYEGDQLEISTTNDIRTYTIKNAGTVVSSGSAIYGGGTVNVAVAGDVSVSITYMDWHYVTYPSDGNPNQKYFDQQSSLNWNYSVTDSFLGDLKVDSSKEWQVRISYYRATDGSIQTSEWYTMVGGQDDVSTGNGCSIGVGWQEFPYIYPNGGGGFANTLRFVVETDGMLTIQNIGEDMGGYANYITSVDYIVNQYEYS